METESDKPQVVYHYTTMDTMLKIVGSKTIWASSVDYLNDTSEGKHFIDQVRDRLPEFSNQRGDGSEFIPEMSKDAEIDLPFQFRPYVASFSSEGDSLPQWRSYCPNGNGVAIGFSVDCLKRAYVPQDKNNRIALRFSPVKYTEKKPADEVIDQDISEIIKTTDAVITATKQNLLGFTPTRKQIFRILVEAEAGRRKHVSFLHEREFRIIVNLSYASPKPALDFRSARTTLIPFVKLEIPEKDSGYEQFEQGSVASTLSGRRRFQFIYRVVIGPTPNKRLSLQAVREYFNGAGIDVEVAPSEIPFRDW